MTHEELTIRYIICDKHAQQQLGQPSTPAVEFVCRCHCEEIITDGDKILRIFLLGRHGQWFMRCGNTSRWLKELSTAQGVVPNVR